MGTAKVKIPANLPEKIKFIRTSLGLSQSEIAEILGIGATIPSGYERGIKMPSAEILLAYANLYNICVNYLVDDNLELPSGRPHKKKCCC